MKSILVHSVLLMFFIVKFVSADSLATFGGSGIAIREIAEDGLYTVDAAAAVVPVDARSRIELRFDAGAMTATGNDSQWKQLNQILEEMKELNAQHAAIVKALANSKTGSPAQVKEARRLASTLALTYAQFVDRVHGILGDDTFKKLDTESLQSERGFLEVLGQWLADRLSSMIPSSSSIPKGSTGTITVLASLEAAGQDPKPLHVENYDRLPEGV